MTQTVDALVTTGPKEPFERSTVERRDPRAHDVVIDIHYAGICHSDIHQAREEWGEAMFPMVPGHEIAGVVREVGADVTKYAVGDRVGVGCFVDSCRECENCQAGEEQYCLKGEVADVQRQASTTASPPSAATAARSWSTRTTCSASPRASGSTSPLRCCAPASRSTRR